MDADRAFGRCRRRAAVGQPGAELADRAPVVRRRRRRRPDGAGRGDRPADLRPTKPRRRLGERRGSVPPARRGPGDPVDHRALRERRLRRAQGGGGLHHGRGPAPQHRGGPAARSAQRPRCPAARRRSARAPAQRLAAGRRGRQRQRAHLAAARKPQRARALPPGVDHRRAPVLALQPRSLRRGVLPGQRAGPTPLLVVGPGANVSDTDDDAGLLAAAAGGDQDAFARLVDRHAGMVIAVCRRHTGDDAEDVAQETFVKAWRTAGSFSGASSVRTWLYRIAINAARDRLRYERRRPASADVSVDELANRCHEPADIDEQLAARGVDAPMRHALAQLAPAQREVVVLADVFGVSHAELARRQDVAPGTIKSRLHRAHARLAELLAPDTSGPAPPAPATEPDIAWRTSKPPR
ncbi:MAG: hypothetical protein BRC31_03050 [Actinobacteria bacterium QS_5_72_10]|nr:MAG: hypothetical protein BRC31_03050 [Actinobacteria bacterium QS_5_72_10]